MQKFVDFVQSILAAAVGERVNCQPALPDTQSSSEGLYHAPQFTDGPCKFVNASDGTKDCVALLITYEMIEDFQKYSHLDVDGHQFHVEREILEDADLLPYHDALEYPEPPRSQHHCRSSSSQQSDSTFVSSGKLLRRAVWARYHDIKRALWEAESEFDFVQEAYSHALGVWREGRAEWTHEIDTRSAFDRKMLRDKMVTTTQLMDFEQDFDMARAEADKHGMLDDIEDYCSDFNPDAEYPHYDPKIEAAIRTERVDRVRIERWMEDMDDVESKSDMEDREADEWEAKSVWFNESGSTMDCEDELLVRWTGHCDALREKCAAEMSYRDLWRESRHVSRRNSWAGVMA